MRIVIALALLAVVGAAAWRLEKRRSGRPVPARSRVSVPAQLVRADFPRPDAPWLLVLFSSESCAGCAPMARKVSVLESPAVAVYEAEWSERRDLHERYGIDGVPLVVLADAEGVVRASFVGATAADELWARVTELSAPR